MKVLITGTDGQLGRALVASAPHGIALVPAPRAVIDLSSEEQIHAVLSQEAPDAVINAGAYTAVDRAESEPDLAEAVNARAPHAIAETLRASGGRLIQISTDFVFDGTSSLPYRPDAARNPVSVYGASKSRGEDNLGSNALICRTSWVYGAGGRNFVNTMLGLMRSGRDLTVVADQIGSPSWTGDLAPAIWAMATSERAGTYHYCDAGVASWYDFAVAIQEEALAIGMLDREVTIAPIPSSAYPTAATRPAMSVLDTATTRADFGLAPHHWRANLRRMLTEEQALG